MIASLDNDSLSGEPQNLYATLATRARGASDAMLATLTAIGGLWTVALAATRPRWWMYALLPIVCGAFGVWGILERAIAERGADLTVRYEQTVSAGQIIAIAVGSIAALVTAFAVLGFLMGPFIN